MEKKMKTILSFVAVALMFAVCFVSIGDGGADAETTRVVSVTIDGGEPSYYDSINAAVTATQERESGSDVVIKLLSDAGTTASLLFTKSGNYTLDIGTYTLSQGHNGYFLAVGGSNPPTYPFDNPNLNAILKIVGTGKINTTNTTFRGYGIVEFGKDGVGPTVTMGNSSHERFSIFKVEEGCKLTVNGGTFNLAGEGNKVTRIMQNWGTTVINGGTFNADLELFGYTPEGGSHYTSTVTINDGIINGKLLRKNGDKSTQQLTDADQFIVKGGSYTDLVNVVKYVEPGVTIKLADDVTITESIVVSEGKDIIIDLNEHNITSTVASPTNTNLLETGTYIDGGHAFLNYGTLTIEGNGTITTNTDRAAIILNLEGGTVDLEGGTYKTKDSNSWYMLANYGTMNIYSGVTVDGLNLATSGSGPSLIFTGWNDETVGEKNVKMNIYGGDFKGGLNTFKNSAWCTLTIHDGNFLNSVQSTVLNWNIMEIYGGSFQQQGTAGKPLIMVGFFHGKSCIGKTTIYDGSFYSANGQPCIGPHTSSYPGYITCIHGGTYSDLSGLPYVLISTVVPPYARTRA